jgi:hypothetical protein
MSRRRPFRDLREHLAVAGMQRLERLPPGASTPLAADEEPVLRQALHRTAFVVAMLSAP